MQNKQYYLTLSIIVLFSMRIAAQVVLEPVTNDYVYNLLDELAALKVITINSVVKPYSRVFIAGKLKDALVEADKLNKRQRAEIEFYLRDYGFELTINNEELRIKNNKKAEVAYDPIALRYIGKVFKASVSPWLGGRFMVNENGNFREFCGGGEVFGYLGKHIGYYANMKYTWESEPLVNPVMFTPEEGKSWSYLGNGSVQNTEWRGGISVGWKWGDFGVFKDRPIWGNGEHGANIFSGHAPSFPYIQLHLYPANWIEFSYMHAWLNSRVIDSTQTNYDGSLKVVKGQDKFISANILTVKPWRGLNISFGNSIIYDNSIQVVYLIPFLFYKSVDHMFSLGIQNMNSQMFLDVKTYQIKKLILGLTLFVDEFKSSRITDPTENNFLSWKGYIKAIDFPVRDMSLIIEGTRTLPLTYQHQIPSITYTSDYYNFGSYLRDNSQEVFILIRYKPTKKLNLQLSYNFAQHGGEFVYGQGKEPTKNQVLKDITWQKNEFDLLFNYRIYSKIIFFMQYARVVTYGDIKYSPAILNGGSNSLIVGFDLGMGN